MSDRDDRIDRTLSEAIYTCFEGGGTTAVDTFFYLEPYEVTPGHVWSKNDIPVIEAYAHAHIVQHMNRISDKFSRRHKNWRGLISWDTTRIDTMRVVTDSRPRKPKCYGICVHMRLQAQLPVDLPMEILQKEKGPGEA